MYFSKKPELWHRYSACVLEGLTVRAAAARLDIDKDTAWRWRHALLDASARGARLNLSGSVETLLRTLPVHGAGPRSARRKARSCVPGSWVLLARDHHHTTAAQAIGRRPARYSDYQALLGTSECAIERLVAVRGPAVAAAGYAALAGLRIEFSRAVLVPMSDSCSKSAGLAEYAARLRDWLRRFRGVAAHYLTTYVHWHGLLDDPGDAAEILLASAQRAPPITRATSPGARC